MNHRFRRDRLPPPRAVYEPALGKLSRPDRKGWAKANCPFHRGKSGTSFSVNLENGSFFCHGCGVKGQDVLAFIRQRDGLSFKEAAQKLGAWDSAPSPETTRKMEQAQRERDRQHEQAEAAKELDRSRVIKIRDHLHVAARTYKAVNQRLSELRQGAIPDWTEELEACWSTLAVTMGDLRKLDTEYCNAAGLEPCE